MFIFLSFVDQILFFFPFSSTPPHNGHFWSLLSFLCVFYFFFFFSVPALKVLPQLYKISSHVPIVSSVFLFTVFNLFAEGRTKGKYFESLKLFFFLYYFYSLLSFKLSTCRRCESQKAKKPFY